MVGSTHSRQRRPPCKTNKEESEEAADAAAVTYLLTSFNVTATSVLEWTERSSCMLATNSEYLFVTIPSGITQCARVAAGDC